jgi:1-acyl-sn-glycerol-3-phosphate acyltransferase
LVLPRHLNAHPLKPCGLGNRLFYACGSCFARLVLKVFFRFRVSGARPPESGPFIIAANHESFLDPLVLQLALTERRIHYMMTATLYYTRTFNLFSSAMRCIPVEENGLNKESLRLGLEVLEAGRPLGIFPQGARMPAGDVTGGFNKGAAFLARKSGVPVIPARLDGTGRALPRGARFLRPARISVVLGAPLDFTGLAAQRPDLDSMTAAIMSGIDSLSES